MIFYILLFLFIIAACCSFFVFMAWLTKDIYDEKTDEEISP